MTKNVIETFLENSPQFAPVKDTFVPAVITSSENNIRSLEPLLEKPLRTEYEKNFDDLRGFVDYVNDYSGDKTVCFAGNGTLTAYMDFHKKDDPSWRKHSVYYSIKNSERWKVWQKNNNVWMDQRAFSEFLDSGLNEITVPTQSEVLDLVKNFRATVNFEVDHEEVPGGTNFKYRKTIKSGSTKQETIEVPEYLTITLQPFDNLNVINSRITDQEKRIPAYQLRAKINWRTNIVEGDATKVEFKIQILNFEKAVDETLEALRSAIVELTGVKTYIG